MSTHEKVPPSCQFRKAVILSGLKVGVSDYIQVSRSLVPFKLSMNASQHLVPGGLRTVPST